MNSNRIKKVLKKYIHPASIKAGLLKIALRGNTVECPCCGSKFVTFLPAGIQKRANAACPQCGSLERHRSLWLFLQEQNELFSRPLKLLHVAPEQLYYQKFSAIKNIEYYPIDLNPGDYDYGSRTIAMDVTDLKYQDNFFDLVICNHVLEHIPDDALAMRELCRVLKPGAMAILNVPANMQQPVTFEDPYINDPLKQEELFGQPDHVRIYGRDYVNRLQSAGFTVTVIDYVQKFNHNQQFRYGLKPVEIIFRCSK